MLGDDLALNAQQVAGLKADRELPVVWAVALGSLRNKAILVPTAILISALTPWLVTPLLMLDGTYLCYEGFEKLAHPWLGNRLEDAARHHEQFAALSDPAVDLVVYEKEKIRGAIRTDFVLSAEIIAITLGTVANAAIVEQVTVLTAVAVLMAAGVYGLVAAIVKLDDAGCYLSRKSGEGIVGRLQRTLGDGLLGAAPFLMNGLAVADTAAMFLVGGGILIHGLPTLHHLIEGGVAGTERLPGVGWVLGTLTPMLFNGLTGVTSGGMTMAAVTFFTRVRSHVSRRG